MTRKAFLTLLCLALLLVGCGTTAQTQTSSSQNVGSANIIVVATSSTNTTVASSGGPTDTPTVDETQPPAQPTNAPTSAGYHSCTANACPNPWNFVLGCSCPWQQVTIAPSGFCSWFHCIPNFDNESGTIGECGDTEMSHAGGLSGMCSGHDGLLGYLYIRGTTTITPTVQPTPRPSPTPQPRMTPSPLPTATTGV